MKRRLLALLLLAGLGADAVAQTRMTTPAAAPVKRDQPAYYQADNAEYDRERGVVTLRGHVELWQEPRLLQADMVTYDRNTGIARARGNVVLLEPDGQTVFADEVELGDAMKDGMIAGLRALMVDNGRLVANGARRTDGRVNELARVIYSTCDLCKEDPTRAPLWQIRAAEAVQDTDNKMIEYRDVVVDLFGVPVVWLPWLTHPDPSQKRASGLLVPNFGLSRHLGAFFGQPYYWVIDDQSDATITPLVATRNGPAVGVDYRRRFNSGSISVNGALAHYNGDAGAYILSRGQFAINEAWRWGFDLQRTTSLNFMRDFHYRGWQSVLTSQAYVEGFGQGAWTRLDARAYQSLSTSVRAEKLPYVLPRWEYDFLSAPGWLGGRFEANAGAFNVFRHSGTNTQRGNASLAWQTSAIGRMGDVWNLRLQAVGAGYWAHQFDQQPNFGAKGTVNTAQAMPTAAVRLNLPLARNAGSWGTQIIEPIIQLAAAPRGSSYRVSLIPNEDSLDQDFTDANLFQLNRFTGIDRLEGGMRANVALHGAWNLPAGGTIDALVGQGFRTRAEPAFRADSGLAKTATDIVSHLSYAPSQWFDVTTRQRFDRKSMKPRFAEAVASGGPDWLRLTSGYTYSVTNPYFMFDTPGSAALLTKPRNEGMLGASTGYGAYKLHASARRDLGVNKMVSLAAGASYEDECFIFDVSYQRRYTSINNDRGATLILFEITLKTVGQFGFHAL